VVRHATDRYVILMLGNYVIGMAMAGLDVIHVIRLRLDRLRHLRHVTLVMVYLLERLLIDLRAREDRFLRVRLRLNGSPHRGRNRLLTFAAFGYNTRMNIFISAKIGSQVSTFNFQRDNSCSSFILNACVIY